jgi:hypothetical protein
MTWKKKKKSWLPHGETGKIHAQKNLGFPPFEKQGYLAGVGGRGVCSSLCLSPHPSLLLPYGQWLMLFFRW